MHLQRAHGRHDHCCVGREARSAALDVEEALGAHVRAKARLSDQELTGVDADQIGDHRRVAGGDVAERARMHEHRRVLERLEQVGLDSIAQDDCHRAGRVQLLGADGFA